jgi:capsular exopolysaccharide synthesis family protein
VGGIGLALVFEHVDTTLNTDKVIEKAVQVPVLARISKTAKKSANSYNPNRSTSFGENLDKIAKNVLYVGDQENIKILLFASTQPGEGKTMVVANLGISLAALNKKVLIIDGDSSSPKMHHFFDLPNEIGLADLLAQDKITGEGVLESPIENLKILPSGLTESTTGEMYSAEKFEAVMRKFEGEYDFILVDTPPMFPIINVAYMIESADGILLVVRRTHANKVDVMDAGKYLAKMEGKFTAAILTEAESGSNNYVHYKQGLG